MTQIGLTAIPSIIALNMITKGDAGNQITKNKLVNAKINPVVKTIFVPNFFSVKSYNKVCRCISNKMY